MPVSTGARRAGHLSACGCLRLEVAPDGTQVEPGRLHEEGLDRAGHQQQRLGEHEEERVQPALLPAARASLRPKKPRTYRLPLVTLSP
jgi:hypothetical protein